MTQRKIKRKWGCGMPLLAIVILVPVLHFGHIWWLQNPKHMLSRFLDLEGTEQITRVNSSYRSGFDYVAQIYLEADSTIIERIIGRGDFSQTDQKSSLLDFEGAPPTASEQLTYYVAEEGYVFKYIAISPDRKRLWYEEMSY